MVKRTYSTFRYWLKNDWDPEGDGSGPNFSEFTIGDVKSGFQLSDHDGWIMMDGRSLSALSLSQQTSASSLGFIGNLPDASGRYLVQGPNLGDPLGSNSISLLRSNLPDFTLNGSTDIAGSHRHEIQYRKRTRAAGNDGDGLADMQEQSYPDNHFTEFDGDHTHTFATDSLNGGVTQVPLDNRPLSLQVNMFVYLGE